MDNPPIYATAGTASKNRPSLGRFLFLSLWLTCMLVPGAAAQSEPARSDFGGVVATVQPLATDAAVDVLADGGNAVDAAVAAALMLGVVDSHNSGLGGGCFILIRKPNGELLAIDGRETAPAGATADMYVREGIADTQLSQTGPLASGVPGALAAYELALRQAGSRTLAALCRPAAEVAAAGFAIDRVMAGNLERNAPTIRRFPATADILLQPDGSPWTTGQVLIQSDLARTYRAIAEQGSAWFYRGEYAEQVDAWMANNGGLLRKKDFQAYRAVLRDPIVTTYRGYQIIGFPPPSSGGIHVAQILNILEAFDLRELHARDPALLVHVVAEAMKLAFADRAHWLGDSDFVRVPRGLIDKPYARQLASRIQLDKAIGHVDHGEPPDWQTHTFGKHTTHIAAADANGYWVAITATINTSFGSKVIVPGTGLLLNNQMDDFAVQPGVPNAFGLVGSEQNRIEPGKRPLSSMSPTIVLKDGQPILTIGAAGGPKIITAVLLGIIRTLDLELPLDEAIAAPRWHHQWRPDTLFVESKLPMGIVNALKKRGHDVGTLESAGVSQGIQRLPDGSFLGVHDPRVPGKAATSKTPSVVPQ
jgi:gamma-glutamyltranspeptidase/glutathione hydrolase